MGLKEISAQIIKEANKPLSPAEIWEIAESQGYKEQLNLKGKTISNTIAALIYTDIKGNPNSIFTLAERKPTRFYLKELGKYELNMDELVKQSVQKTTNVNKSYLERDLHSLLSYYVYSNPNLSIYTKTIRHEESKKDGYAQWQHPDIVGAFFPMEDWEKETFEVAKNSSIQYVKLFSYELKRTLNFSNLRASFFQAVSNSSWANEGYLVVAEIDKREEFIAELSLLSGSFGIGVILLDTDSPDDSEIMFQARQKDVLDIEMMNKISHINPVFREFLAQIISDLTIKEVRKEKYDKILKIDDLMKLYEAK